MQSIFLQIENHTPINWNSVLLLSDTQKKILSTYLNEERHLPYFKQLFENKKVWEQLSPFVSDGSLRTSLEQDDLPFAWEMVQYLKNQSSAQDLNHKVLCFRLGLSDPLYIWHQNVINPNPSNTFERIRPLLQEPFFTTKDLKPHPLHEKLLKSMCCPKDAMCLASFLPVSFDLAVHTTLQSFETGVLDDWLVDHPKRNDIFEQYFSGQLYPNLTFPKTWAMYLKTIIDEELKKQDDDGKGKAISAPKSKRLM